MSTRRLGAGPVSLADLVSTVLRSITAQPFNTPAKYGLKCARYMPEIEAMKNTGFFKLRHVAGCKGSLELDARSGSCNLCFGGRDPSAGPREPSSSTIFGIDAAVSCQEGRLHDTGRSFCGIPSKSSTYSSKRPYASVSCEGEACRASKGSTPGCVLAMGLTATGTPGSGALLSVAVSKAFQLSSPAQCNLFKKLL